jgi:ADP-ribose pyrophosphatase YjhB (NUDIX family)
MTINTNELVRTTAPVIERDPTENAWQKSAEFMNKLSADLIEGADFSKLEEVDINYAAPFDATLARYPKQAVAIIVLNQPTWLKTWSGVIDPDSEMIVSQRSQANRWAPGTWAVPMGKIDKELDEPEKSSLGQVIGNAVRRELSEEVIRNSRLERPFIASSFLDKTTQALIHVAFAEVLESPIYTQAISLSLPDLREHQRLGWISLKDFPKLSPMTDNVKFLLLTAINFMKKTNQELEESFTRRRTT